MKRSAASGRRIFANLDCEAEFAAMDGRPRAALSTAALDNAAALATLLRAFAEDGDRLWTPAPVAPERLAEVPGLPRPELESGPPLSLPPCARLLAWGETETAAALRRNAGSAGVPPASSKSRQDAGAPSRLQNLLWRLPAADPAIAAKVHHRGFALDLATRLGCALPGAALLASTAELEGHLLTTKSDAWVLKAPWSAAGRSRHVVHGEPAPADRRRIERLFARHGELLFEPWLDRRDDFGIVGVIDGDGARQVGFHRSFTAPRGGFLGVELKTSFGGIFDLDDRERQRLDEIFDSVAQALLAAGYRGPFGIDCWRYRRPSGEPSFHPLGEINARVTFGLVTRALVDRVRGPLGIDMNATVRLRWGPGDPPEGAVPLLHRGDSPRSLAAWLEVPAGSPQDPAHNTSE